MKKSLLSLAAAALCAGPLLAQSVVRIEFEHFPGPDGLLGTPDDIPITAPTLFATQTSQLTTEFSTLGILFTPNPSVNDKNEILDSATFTTPPAHTRPNLLASSGALTISGEFTVPVFRVSALIGISGGSDILEIFDGTGASLGSIVGDDVTVTLSSTTPIHRFEVRPNASTTPAIDNLEFETGGFGLSLAGACPGPVTLTASGATPGGAVAFLYAFGTGSFAIPPGFPCAGTVLGLDSSVRLGGTASASAGGTATLSASAPAAACGRVFLQAVDLSSCATSNVLGL